MTSRGGLPPRRVSVPPERLARWVDGFLSRHGAVSVHSDEAVIELTAADGARARLAVPFPPLPQEAGAPVTPLIAAVVAHAMRRRRVAVLLVRAGAFAVGVFDGPDLLASKTDTRYVQGRTAAGGWSQQRYARRREQQQRESFAAAADAVARVVLPHRGSLHAVVLGGDRRAGAAVLADRRLEPLRPLVTPRVLDVPEPRRAVLDRAPDLFRAVLITVTEPADRDAPGWGEANPANPAITDDSKR